MSVIPMSNSSLVARICNGAAGIWKCDLNIGTTCLKEFVTAAYLGDRNGNTLVRGSQDDVLHGFYQEMRLVRNDASAVIARGPFGKTQENVIYMPKPVISGADVLYRGNFANAEVHHGALILFSPLNADTYNAGLFDEICGRSFSKSVEVFFE